MDRAIGAGGQATWRVTATCKRVFDVMGEDTWRGSARKGSSAASAAKRAIFNAIAKMSLVINVDERAIFQSFARTHLRRLRKSRSLSGNSQWLPHVVAAGAGPPLCPAYRTTVRVHSMESAA
eukprot:TRINITY_DN5075_c0_g1_i1.p3 TRINITY_DN5075_c0_g1~~TRINITY_DN5075_c0_g1_i1.p3  ORF type:complete len:122 (+),score=13.05 TRINITY_DN5075_c0_g1_i1:470-835(+)